MISVSAAVRTSVAAAVGTLVSDNSDVAAGALPGDASSKPRIKSHHKFPKKCPGSNKRLVPNTLFTIYNTVFVFPKKKTRLVQFNAWSDAI